MFQISFNLELYKEVFIGGFLSFKMFQTLKMDFLIEEELELKNHWGLFSKSWGS